MHVFIGKSARTGVAKNAGLIDDFATILDPGPLYYSASDVNVIVQIIS